MQRSSLTCHVQTVAAAGATGGVADTQMLSLDTQMLALILSRGPAAPPRPWLCQWMFSHLGGILQDAKPEARGEVT